ncbi:hypothetical protein OSSY52_01800 [Tepiditoga spiralis]|uniref:Damage-control phosphatase ARMT1-like metal-binding domain-containing protein n=1 Tax=Tepiditoga spiralis TaxID=2108365 RepID=A0A7G1G9P0_9BACT|nr:ARMT1-like domain-containing protein [Tepiditoga spiralis]BBE30039.1 hypothetical protein OSSY52_01800 [Tepiditoga spiralis]
MKAEYECIGCIIKHTQSLIEKADKTNKISSEKKFEDYKKVISDLIKNLEYGKRPIELSVSQYDSIYELYGKQDFFINEKTNANQIFLEMYDDLFYFIMNSENPLKTAAKLSAISNIIDYGVKNSFGELEFEIETMAKKRKFAIDDFKSFNEKLKTAKKILFIHDNAGEIVLDKLFIKTIKKFYPDIIIYSAVRSAPIINDATLKDTDEINLKELSIPIESGSVYPGTIFEKTNETFKNIFEKSDIIISKGQGNFEGLNKTCEKIYFILTAKCSVVSQELNVKVGEFVFKRDVVI